MDVPVPIKEKSREKSVFGRNKDLFQNVRICMATRKCIQQRLDEIKVRFSRLLAFRNEIFCRIRLLNSCRISTELSHLLLIGKYFLFPLLELLTKAAPTLSRLGN